MNDLLRAIVRAPVLDSGERTFQARILHRVVWATLACTTLFLVLLILEQPATLARRVDTVVWLAGLAALALGLNRWSPRAAGWLFVGGLVGLVASGAWATGGISAPQINSFVLFVLMAGVLLGTRGAMIVGACCIAIGLALVLAEQRRTLPDPALEFTPLSTWLYGGIWITLAALLQHQVGSALRAALERAEGELAERRRSQRALEDAQDRLRELAAGLQIAREDERRTLAMDIHDEIGGGLAVVSLGLRRIRRDVMEGSDVAVERLERACGDLDRVGDTVRRLARDIRPAVLDEFGVVAAIRALVDDMRDRSMARIELRVSDEASAQLPPSDGIHVYRIVQEALTNAVKHSGSRAIVVTVTGSDDALAIAVEDDGRGLPWDPGPTDSLGMINMQHRAQLVGGALQVESAAGRGTRLRLSVPRQPALPAAT